VLALAAQATTVACASGFFVIESAGITQNAEANAKYKDVFEALDSFVKQYMREMNSPGMTLVLANRDGILRAASYGFSDLERGLNVKPEQLFHIGSISKSFTAIALLQLREEGKLDLHQPVVEYLPWLTPAVYDGYVGEYEIAPSFSITITKENNKLMAQATGQPKLELLPESQTKFFVKEAAVQIEFVVEGTGKATSLVLYQGGRQLPAKKIK